MTSRTHPSSPLEPNAEALFRYAVVSDVLAREQRGLTRAQAVRDAAAFAHVDFEGKARRISPRTVYRWLAGYEHGRFAALVPAHRKRIERSVVLPPELVAFLHEQKRRDFQASVPEILRRARADQIVSPTARVDRSTLWRELRRAALPTARRRRRGPDADQRRFAYPHRMQMNLADGKHFRAGVARARRVAFFYLDDATRRCLSAIVSAGTGEAARVFLLGLHDVLGRFGLPGVLFLDGGSAFIAHVTHEVCRRLGILVIHGTESYPEGHGKVERFNRTVTPVLAALNGRPDVDPDPAALTLRLRHYLETLYNRTPHEELEGHLAPAERFDTDPRPLRFPASRAHLHDAFVTHFTRCVSHDHVVPIDGTGYEVPSGHAGASLQIHHHLLDDTYAVVHRGELVRIHPVDLAANARSRRARRGAATQESTAPPEPTAADRLFQRDLAPVVDADGGCPDTPEAEDP